MACRAVMERFAERGHEIVVLTGDHRMAGVEDRAESGAVEVRRTLKGWWDWEKWALMSPPFAQRVRAERHNQKALRRALRDFRPDIASIWNLGMTSWTLPTILEGQRVPLVLTFGDDWVTYAFTFDAWTRIFDRRPWARPIGAVMGLETRLPAFTGAEANVASRFIGDLIERNGRWKFPGAPVMPIGVDTAEFPVSSVEDRPWSWRLLYVGRVIPEKGVPTLVRSLVHMPEATLVVDGTVSSQERDRLTALAAELGVGHRLNLTRSPRSELAGCYRRADLVVFASEWPEPYGIVPLEAMACGVPVIATGTGGSGEFLVDGVNCRLFQPGDPVSLAAAARNVAEDADLRATIVAGGLETARRLTMDHYADELEGLHVQARDRAGRS
ncbi:MAG TPA: glycosyltransferase family 4 protein [Acidimicrobiales bacterium]|nr:glycosyltransferase family 4 protein [Acidimicrobiales bacterium]